MSLLSPALTGRFFTTSATWEAQWKAHLTTNKAWDWKIHSLTITHNIDNFALNNIIYSVVNIIHLNFTGLWVVFKCYFLFSFIIVKPCKARVHFWFYIYTCLSNSILKIIHLPWEFRRILFSLERVHEGGLPGGSVVRNPTHLPMQETWVWSLIWEDPTCCGATKPVHHKYWTCALEPRSHS